jgi:valyl-tRNA synthetase
MTEKNINTTYNPKEVEDRIYNFWVDKNYFHAEPDPDKEAFTIVIPPPNITGQLHMGHALNNTMQDILIRWKRMQGYNALWLPGTDHASIATEARIVQEMKKEGISKKDLGREKFLERAWEWKKHYGGRIITQLKKLGSSCDWERERFTLDDGLTKAVEEVFIRLYEKGLIYRGERIINWCPNCKTSISNAEVDFNEHDGNFWHMKYPVKDSESFITVATTRPETMLGDTAVAVNPDDKRYKDMIGKTVILPLVNREIPIIADDYVDAEFGTGAVKITPAHDPNDFEVGKRHNLPEIKVMDDMAVMNEMAGDYKGLDRYEARKKIVKDLESQGLLLKTEPHKHNVGSCYRCSTVIEPTISLQWFVKMDSLAKPAIKAVKDGEVKFIPERFAKVYYNWMENIQDWCISRQLWWGHRIPAYYCQECGKIIVAKEMPDTCPDCGSSNIKQDEDTLDTWFSSALWPFSTLGWPDNTEDLKYFYPTDVLVTASDIIFFWVARMIFSAIEHMDSVPFDYVLINSLVRDSQGRKMSKSLGNGIDPLEVIDEFGTDALRYALTAGNSPGNDIRFSTDRIESSRNFANKIWNASRFVLLNFDENPDFESISYENLLLPDKWILSRLNTLIKEVTENLNKFESGIALTKIYEYIWDEFCDWYIEIVKPRLYEKDSKGRLEALYTLNTVLSGSMKLLHPFMPFITEEIYSHLITEDESIMISSWPVYKEELDNKDAEKQMDILMKAIRSIRNTRAEMNVPPKRKAKVIVVSENIDIRSSIENSLDFFERLSNASETIIQKDKKGIDDNSVPAVIEGAEIFMPLSDLVDIEKEIARLNEEKAKLENELKRVDGKLSNKNFTEKAPQKVIEAEKEKQIKYRDMYNKVIENIKKLG